jgi:hypothetical protein
MAKTQTMTGSRAKILINGKTVGLFSQCSWSIRQSKEPIYVLGRYSPADIVGTDQQPVQMTLTGYRVIDAGPYKVANATMLKDLLNEEDFTITVQDRQTKKIFFQAVGCKVLGWSSGVASRGITDIRLEVVGLIGADETSLNVGDQEDASAVNITDGQ